MRSARLLTVALAAAAVTAATAVAAPAPPHGPHPRIALSPTVLAALKADLGTAGSGAALAVEECKKANVGPGSQSGYQGLDWASAASSCALAYQLTHDRAYAARGITLWRALLEDVATIGDHKACVAGASPQQAIASIRRDTGYAIRFIGLHTALAYDWLHDAPGADEALRKQSRDCFRAWIEWYTAEGYMRNVPGANYNAGFVGAKTLIAVAESGEDGPQGASARFWSEAVDDVFGKQIVGNGLAADAGGTPGREHHGALVGGDWSEGWQYGPLSVVEYALAARALAEQGVSWPELRAWLDALTVRFVYALTPDRKWTYVGGDSGGDTPNLSANPGPLVATLIGPSSEPAAAWAADLRRQLASVPEGPPVFLALADARTKKPAAPPAGRRPLAFLARGTRTLYARSAWTPDAFWAVFTSPPRLVPDHQHMDASNFVFSRGADPLIVDPSPYAARGTLTGNALTLDTTVVPGDYAPSQTMSSLADLPWSRATASGVVAARAELEGAFKFADYPSDVPLARRDWAFLPEGEVVVIDRAITGGPTRNMYLRFRTPAHLAPSPTSNLSYPVARGLSGTSAVAIHAVTLRPAAARPKINVIARGECKESFGACTAARFDVNEYALKLAGAEVLAVHVIDGLGRGDAPAEVSAMGGGVVGASVRRGGKQTYVVAAAEARATPPAALGYRVPGAQPSRHVVFDAPQGGDSDGAGGGRTSVTATAAADGSCAVTLAPPASGGKAIGARPAIFLLAPASAGCKVTEDPDLGPATGLAADEPAAAGRKR